MNSDNRYHRSMDFTNSPIEFVIVGPWGTQDRILVRSRSAKLDLVGFAVSCAQDAHDSPNTPKMRRGRSRDIRLGGLLGLRRRFYSVSAFVTSSSVASPDERSVGYFFCWATTMPQNDIDLIAKEFSQRIIDIDISIGCKDIDSLEWNIAPLVRLCATPQDNIKLTKLYVSVTFLYGICIIGFLLYYFILKRLP